MKHLVDLMVPRETDCKGHSLDAILPECILCLIYFLLCIPAKAQTCDWEDFLDDYMDSQTEDDGTESDLDRLEEMHSNPFNLNACDREDLLQLPFIGPEQADSILCYIRRYGAILSAGELSLIHSIDYRCRVSLPLFVYFGEAPNDKSKATIPVQLLHGRQEVAGVLGIPFYKRKGFRPALSDAAHLYAGSRYHGSLRYRCQYENSLYAGLTGENDDGEAFARKGNHPFDAYSFYLLRKSSTALKVWAIGDYRIHIGMGLTAGTGFMNSGMGLLTSRHGHAQGIFPHSGTDEYLYYRGAATTIAFDKLQITLFASQRSLDARIVDNKILSVSTTGYHRLPTEIERRDAAKSDVYGVSADLNLRSFRIGASTIYSHYNHAFKTGDRPYQQYGMKGKDFICTGLHYQYDKGDLNLNGETAVTPSGETAFLHDVRYEPFRNSRFYLLHRYYSSRYQAPQAWVCTGSGKCRGEHGVMTGFTIQPQERWNVAAFADGYHLLTASYRATKPSNGYTLQTEVTFSPSDAATLSLRYRLRSQQENSNTYPELLYAMKHSLRLQSRLNLNRLHCTFSLGGCYYKPAVGKTQYGGIASGRLSTEIVGCRIEVSLTAFHTQGYQSSISAYQPSLLYARSYSSFFYHGYAAALSLRRRIGRRLELACLCNGLHYTNRKSIGSADRTIGQPGKTDLTIQIRYLF